MNAITPMSLLAVAAALPAQFCPDQGSMLQPARLEAGPEQHCSGAPGWPHWHLYTPPFRAVVPRRGMQQGPVRAVPRLLLRWRCTGYLLLPVVIAQVRTMGFELDVAEEACRLSP